MEIDGLYSILAPLGAEKDVSMAAHTSFRIGGPAALFFEPKDPAELMLALKKARELHIPITLMGNGTNLLVRDGGVEGLVLKLGPRFSGFNLEGSLAVALAGTLLSSLAAATVRAGYMGLEWAAGIPGTVGGALAMNAGAYGGDVKGALQWVEYLDMPTGKIEKRQPAEAELGYRRSSFSWPERVVLRAAFRIEADDGQAQARMADYNQRRREKQPLQYPSAGSTFKRPPGHYAGALIEEAGLKGLSVGGAEVSRLHAGFIINRGGATCADVLALIEQVQARVLASSGVELTPEIRIIGRDKA